MIPFSHSFAPCHYIAEPVTPEVGRWHPWPDSCTIDTHFTPQQTTMPTPPHTWCNPHSHSNHTHSTLVSLQCKQNTEYSPPQIPLPNSTHYIKHTLHLMCIADPWLFILLETEDTSSLYCGLNYTAQELIKIFCIKLNCLVLSCSSEEI